MAKLSELNAQYFVTHGNLYFTKPSEITEQNICTFLHRDTFEFSHFTTTARSERPAVKEGLRWGKGEGLNSAF